MERRQHRPVAGSVVGADGSPEVLAPDGRTSGAHLVGRQLVHAWNTPEAQSGPLAGRRWPRRRGLPPSLGGLCSWIQGSR